MNLKDFTGKVTKVLIANRGEIAVRVIRSCHEMGIPTVAIYSDPDRAAMHVRMAKEAYHVGPAAASESYLRVDRILEIAKRSGADAIHPGYGFLSENPSFARAVKDAGFTFIGPPPSAMESMATKTQARRLMSSANVPVVPGLEEGIDDEVEALTYAESIGFPVMLKASAGGGGKGMRKVSSAAEFSDAWSSARSEARNSFGDDEVYIEKFLEEPHHIEIQVFADAHGQVHHLFERECSVQRRHQKVIEEAPSPFVDPAMRKAMGDIACRAAKAVNYLGAGTVEFLVDKHKNFYFMEMNTRLQVEHPVTEEITGLDLVEAQIRVARGEKLPWGDQPTHYQGWAIEARICAEDPEMGFVPTPGPIHELDEPKGPGVRIDSCVYAGSEVTPDYDPMIAKVIVHARTRERAIAKLSNAIQGYTLKGMTTNCMFIREMLENPEFTSGNYDTGIVERFMEKRKNTSVQEQGRQWIAEEHVEVALIAAALIAENNEGRVQLVTADGESSNQPSVWQRRNTAQRW